MLFCQQAEALFEEAVARLWGGVVGGQGGGVVGGQGEKPTWLGGFSTKCASCRLRASDVSGAMGLLLPQIKLSRSELRGVP